MSNMDLLMQSWVAAKASISASCINSEGKSIKLSNCGINTQEITTLADYLKKQDPTKLENLDPERTTDSDKLMRTYVIPVVTPNGQEIDVVVNSKGQDMACIYKDEEGKQNVFTLTPRMKNEILSKSMVEIQGKIDPELIKAALFPATLEELAKDIEKDTLVPKSSKEAVEKIKSKNKSADIEVMDKEEQEKESEEEQELPEEIRDEVAKLCSENDYNIEDLKEVMMLNPQVITNKLEETGISENGENVYCLRFRDARLTNDRIVMLQPGRPPVDERTYDDHMTDYMNNHREKDKKIIEDDHDKIYFTDVHGHTTVDTIRKEPRDLTCTDKERLQKRLEELDSKYNSILNMSKSSISLEDKAALLGAINKERLGVFKEFGIEAPLVEQEIRADNSIDEEMEKIGAQHREEREAKKELEAEKEIEDDGHDPREGSHDSHEDGRIPKYLQ